MDETMNGEYEYPGLRLLLTRLDDEEKRQVFIDG